MSKNKLNLIELYLGDELYNMLKDIKKTTKIPLTKIVILVLNEKLESIKELNYNKEFIQDDKNNNEEYEIRFRIQEKEKIFLENQIEKTGNKSLTSEIRYRLLNTMYKNKFFLPMELSELSNLIFQVKRVGLNLNFILKQLNSKEELKKDELQNLENYANELNEKIDLITKEVKEILVHSRDRF